MVNPVAGPPYRMLIVAAPESGPVPCRSSSPNVNWPAMSSVVVSTKPGESVVVLGLTNVSCVELLLAGTAGLFVVASTQPAPLDQLSLAPFVGV